MTTYPTDGRKTSLASITGSLTGGELIMIVSPGNASQGVNNQLTAGQLASLFVQSLPPQMLNLVFAESLNGDHQPATDV